MAGYTLPVLHGADTGIYTLRDALEIANQYHALNGWLIRISPNYDGGALLVPSSVGDHGVGDSAFLVTGNVTIDGSAVPANSTIFYGNYGPCYNGHTKFHVAGNVLIDGSQVPGLKIESTGGQK